MSNPVFRICLLAILFAQLLSCKQGSKVVTLEDEVTSLWVEYMGKADLKKKKKIVLVTGDEEYRSEEALPQLGKILAQHHGFDCTVLFSQDPERPGIIHPAYTKNIPGLEELKDADLMILFTRFRDLPDAQMEHIESFLKKGKPILAIRTATHAFHVKDSTSKYAHWGNYYDGHLKAWEGGFGKKVLGVNWHSHHGQHAHQSQRGIFPEQKDAHAILQGINDGALWGPTDVYGVPLPMSADVEYILLGQVVDREAAFDESDLRFGMRESDHSLPVRDDKTGIDKNDPMMPIVWLKPYQIEAGQMGKTICSTVGSSTDMLDEELRRLFVNATYFLLNLAVPEKANVDIVGQYSPSQFKFHKEGYWEKKNMTISSQNIELK